MEQDQLVYAAPLDAVQAAGKLVVSLNGHAILLIAENGHVYALDNRCPHMGFPLDRGTVCDGLLTCHWHHARFDLATGGTFDLWAGDVRTYRVEIRGNEVWVDLTPTSSPVEHALQRLQDGLAHNLSLVLAKAALTLAENKAESTAYCEAARFGVRYRQAGWGPGLTILICMQNLAPWLAPQDRPLALYHGIVAVAADTQQMPPHLPVRPLPGPARDNALYQRWFRQFVDVRDREGAERCLLSMLTNGADPTVIAETLFAAITDHRYVSLGHPLDFTNKALEALDGLGWDLAPEILPSLVPGYVNGDRMEEHNQWRRPIDLVRILEQAFDVLPQALEQGQTRATQWSDETTLLPVLLGDDPQAIADALLDALRDGAKPAHLAAAVTYAAALRIAQFPTSNEFSDWDTALHTLSFAHAVERGLRRVPSPWLLRGVFDAAMSVYLDRFLNIPAVRIPSYPSLAGDPHEELATLATLLDRQQQVQAAAETVARYQAKGGAIAPLVATLGQLLLREDRNFHTIQMVEAAVSQVAQRGNTPESWHMLLAATRYLAAHAPTARSQVQTYRIAARLHRGERLYETVEREDGAALSVETQQAAPR